MSRQQVLVVNAIILLLAPGIVSSSQAEPGALLNAGHRVKVAYGDTVSVNVLGLFTAGRVKTSKVEGVLISFTDDTIMVASDYPEGDTSRITMELVRRIWVNDGEKPNTLKGTLVGAGIGAGTALLFLAVASDESGGSSGNGYDNSPDALAVTTLGIGGGALLGGFLGSLVKTDRWEEVDRSNWPVQLGLLVRNKAVGLHLTLAF